MVDVPSNNVDGLRECGDQYKRTGTQKSATEPQIVLLLHFTRSYLDLPTAWPWVLPRSRYMLA